MNALQVSNYRIPRRSRPEASPLSSPYSSFFLIACGFGYPIRNRFDPRQTPGLSDVKTYAALVTGTTIVDAEDLHFRRFRVLLPWIARPFYALARGRAASWDPVLFGLLIADSLFVAATRALIVIIGSQTLSNSAAGLIGALLYMVNFAIPNLRLVGFVDAGEGFFLLALRWSLSERKLSLLPVIAVLGALTKESFIPFSIVITFAWWLTTRPDHLNGKEKRYRSSRDAAWILASWVLSVAAMIALHWSITGIYGSPLQFGSALQRGGELLLAHRQRDEFLDPEVHRLHEQIRINGLAHQEEIHRGKLPGKRGDLFQRVARIRIQVHDRQQRTVRTAQDSGERFHVRELRHRQGSESDQESRELFPVGVVRVDDDTIHLHVHNTASLG